VGAHRAVAVLVGLERRSIQLHTATPVISTTGPWLDFIDGFGFVLPKWVYPLINAVGGHDATQVRRTAKRLKS
jgi:hypothetical protein